MGTVQKSRRSYTRAFKEEPVQMLLNGHSAAPGAERLGVVGNEHFVSLEKGCSWKGRMCGGAAASRILLDVIFAKNDCESPKSEIWPAVAAMKRRRFG